MSVDQEMHAALEGVEAAARRLASLAASRVHRADLAARQAAASAPPAAAARSPTTAAAVHVDADEWWAHLPPDRREQIRRWITQRDRHHEPVDGQLDALDHLTQHDDDQEPQP